MPLRLPVLLRPLRVGLLLAAASLALAATSPRTNFDLPAGDAVDTLRRAAQQAGREIMFPAGTVRGVRTAAVRGEFTLEDAVRRMIAGTPLVLVRDQQTGALAIDRSASTARGTVEGRVSHGATGDFLEGARVVVEGAGLETYTDAGGYFRLAGLPAGTVGLQVFYSGFPAVTERLTVAADETARRDIALAPTPGRPGDSVVKLSEFVISSSREMSSAALAINEQRHAPNLRSVVATDELGFVPEGNVAEFIKFLPGVSVDNVGGFARNVSIDGVPAEYVPITIDGFSVASANPGGGTARNVSLDMLSINNLSRVEVVFSPTPESQGSALAGSVNMVPRSAFERAKPVVNWNAYLLMRDNARDFHKTPGPQRRATRKVHPGFDFTYLRPVNRNFGFTISAGTSKNYLNQDFTQNAWRGALQPTNGAAFPHTTPDRPYLTSYLVRDNTKDSTRNSFSTTLDARLGPRDRLSLAFQFSSTAFANMSRTLTFNITGVEPGAFGPTATRGRPGAGNLQLANTGQTRDNRTVMPTLVWRHTGPVWHAEAGLGYSRANHTLRNMDRGLFNTTTAQRTGVTISFDDIFYLRPRVITVADGATGAPLDPYRIDNYVLTAAGGSEQHTTDTQRTAYANVRRDFGGAVPFTLKAGLDVRAAARDLRATSQPFSYVGADGRASTAPGPASDDSAAPFLDAGASTRIAPFGFPRIQWVSNEGVLEAYRANPARFVPNLNNAYRSGISGSKYVSERVSSAYLRGDVHLLERRLKLVGGVRGEQTDISARGPLSDPTLNFQRDSRGEVVLGANGRPLALPGDALAVSQRTFLERASRTRKQYLRLFPSLNASYQLRENLIARAAVYRSVGRPNFNQYAGGITLPDTEEPPGVGNRIVVNNAGIKAWSARTFNARIEYYFAGVGQLSLGGFRRDYENFFATSLLRATPELLALYGIDPAVYGDYEVSTQANLAGTVRTTGVNAGYKQSLGFLPRWARGIHVFANATAQRATGDTAGEFAGYVPRTYNWGFSLARERFLLRANWNYRGRQRLGAVAAGTGIEPGTFNWGLKKMSVDLQGDFQLHRFVTLFVNLRNVTNATEDFEVAGPSTPPEAQFRSRQDFGSLWTVGFKGSF